jgi:hypothetical protein
MGSDNFQIDAVHFSVDAALRSPILPGMVRKERFYSWCAGQCRPVKVIQALHNLWTVDTDHRAYDVSI